MAFKRSALAAIAIIACSVPAASAQSDSGERAVNIYQYAIDHPVEDAALSLSPSLGASVPQTVMVATPEGDTVYGYFYYAGRPIIVELSTRSVVRVDD